MKKLLLFIFALCTVSGAWADDPVNLALNKTAIATSGTATAAVDGNNETRWESASSDPQTWQVDLGEATTFNTISIRWEGAYGKTFTIEVGNDVDANGYLTGGIQVVSIEDQSLSGFPYVQNLQFEAKTARYIKFTGTARGTGYGYSFWEFGVYNLAEKLTLTTLEITSAKTSVMASKTTTFTAKGKDQLDGVVNPGTLTWNSSNETVGTISNGTFTAIAEGSTNITATANSGLLTSNSVSMTVTALIEPTDVPTPTKDAENVKAVYSHNYTEVGANIEGSWARTDVKFNDKKALKVNNFSWIQFTLGATHKAQGMERIHLDVFPTENMPTIVIRAKGDGFSKQKMKDLTNGTWDNNVDFSLTADLGLTEEEISNITVIQIVKNNDGAGNGNGTEEFYIGNLYFYKEAINPSSITSVTVTAVSSSIAEGNTTQLTVKDQSNNTVTGLMTFNSSNTSVATVSASGLVTAVSPGTARITATVTGYEVSNYIDITITETSLGFDATSADGNHTVHVTPYHYVGTDDYKLVITSEETMTGMGGSFWNINGVGGTRVDANTASQTFNLSDDKHTITITTTSDPAPSFYTPLYVLYPGEGTFKKGGDNFAFDWIDVQEVRISPYKWASFSSTKALDFGKVDGLTAYIATDNNGKELEYNTVNKVPASTGLLLNGDEGTYDVPVIDSAPALVSENLLKPAVTATVISAEDAATGKYYAFGRIGENVGFVKMAATGYTVSAGKSYLLLTAALAAKGFDFIDLPGSETDGINKVNTLVETGVRYNLAGQRVSNDYKGIVVVNGKKYLRK